MEKINVREVMKEVDTPKAEAETPNVRTERVSMVTDTEPSAKDASERLLALNRAYEQLAYGVNCTNTSGTSEYWRESYEDLTEAFFRCIAAEKEIIVRM